MTVDRADAQPAEALAARSERRRRFVYAALVLMIVAVAAGSLAISAPAWWPGHPRRTPMHSHHELAQRMRELQEDQLQRLERYAWRDRAAGVVAIPIERAMTLWLAEARQQQTRHAVPQEAPAP